MDSIERFGMGFADKIVANSKFTRKVINKTFPKLQAEIDILYPTISYEKQEVENANGIKFFVSVNRYERKKNHELAIKAYSLLRSTQVKLVIAGGYDPRLNENVDYFDELYKFAQLEQLKATKTQSLKDLCSANDVFFMTNVN